MERTAEITVPQNYLMRPDEWGGVTVDLDRGLLYVGSRDGTLLALSDLDAEVVWERQVSGAISSAPVLTDEGATLLVGTHDGLLLALDLEKANADLGGGGEGAVRWRHQTTGRIDHPPVVIDDGVFFANSRDQVFALSAKDGGYRWQYERDFQKDFTIYGRAGLAYMPEEDPEAVEVGTLFTGFDDGAVVAIGASSGHSLWITDLSPPDSSRFVDSDGTPLVDETRGQLIVSNQETGVHGLDLKSGERRWRSPMRGASTVRNGPAGTYVVSSSLEGIYALETEGRVRWHLQVDPGVVSAPTMHDDIAFLGHSEGGLLAVDARNGTLLAQLTTGSGISSAPVVDPRGDRLYAISNRGTLVVFASGAPD